MIQVTPDYCLELIGGPPISDVIYRTYIRISYKNNNSPPWWTVYGAPRCTITLIANTMPLYHLSVYHSSMCQVDFWIDDFWRRSSWFFRGGLGWRFRQKLLFMKQTTPSAGFSSRKDYRNFKYSIVIDTCYKRRCHFWSFGDVLLRFLGKFDEISYFFNPNTSLCRSKWRNYRPKYTKISIMLLLLLISASVVLISRILETFCYILRGANLTSTYDNMQLNGNTQQ